MDGIVAYLETVGCDVVGSGRSSVWVWVWSLLAVLSLPAGAADEIDIAALPDPTRPVPGQAAAGLTGEGPVLQSTLISPRRRVAVIDGRPYSVGDQIDGAQVTAIRSYEVELQEAGRSVRLRLVPELNTKRMQNES